MDPAAGSAAGTRPAIERDDDLLSEPAAGGEVGDAGDALAPGGGGAAPGGKPQEATDEKKAVADRQAKAERETKEFVAEAAAVLQMSDAQVELVAEELANPRLRVLPAAEQAGALTMIGELARFRELNRSAQQRLHEAEAENLDITALIEDVRIKAAEYDEAVSEGNKEIERIKQIIAEARESKAAAERRRIDAEVTLERRGHVVESITGELAQYAAGESDRQSRLKVLLGEKKKS